MNRAPRALLADLLSRAALLVLLNSCILDWDPPITPPAPSGGSGGGGGGDAACPPSAPSRGERCDAPGLTCEYGLDPRPACRAVVVCEQSAWSPEPRCDCPPLPPCFLEPEEPGEDSCPVDIDLCALTDGTLCACTEGRLRCITPSFGCPSAAPNAGQPCAPEGQVCRYGSCDAGTQIERRCRTGVWEDLPLSCTNASCP